MCDDTEDIFRLWDSLWLKMAVLRCHRLMETLMWDRDAFLDIITGKLLSTMIEMVSFCTSLNYIIIYLYQSPDLLFVPVWLVYTSFCTSHKICCLYQSIAFLCTSFLQCVPVSNTVCTSLQHKYLYQSTNLLFVPVLNI
jgi:hypothetical protein